MRTRRCAVAGARRRRSRSSRSRLRPEDDAEAAAARAPEAGAGALARDARRAASSCAGRGRPSTSTARSMEDLGGFVVERNRYNSPLRGDRARPGHRPGALPEGEALRLPRHATVAGRDVPLPHRRVHDRRLLQRAVRRGRDHLERRRRRASPAPTVVTGAPDDDGQHGTAMFEYVVRSAPLRARPPRPHRRRGRHAGLRLQPAPRCAAFSRLRSRARRRAAPASATRSRRTPRSRCSAPSRARAPASTSSRAASSSACCAPAATRSRSSSPGVGKSRDEMAARARRRHPDVQRRVAGRARARSTRSRASAARAAPIALRVNPDVDPQDAPVHLDRAEEEQVRRRRSTGALELYARAATMPALEIVGVDCHIGSQLTDARARSRTRSTRMVATLDRRSSARAGTAIRYLDIGGGLGIAYGDGAAAGARRVRRTRSREAPRDLDVTVHRRAGPRRSSATPARCSPACST